MVHKKFSNLRCGFTIIEIIIVISIIGLIAGIAGVSFNIVLVNARDQKRDSQIIILSQYLEKYYEKNGEYPSCSDMSESADIIARDVLIGIDKTTLFMPLSESDHSSIVAGCGELVEGEDVVAYIGNDDASCLTGDSCLNYTLKYNKESSETVITKSSKNGFIDTPVNPVLSVNLNGSNVEASVQPIICGAGSLAQYSFSNRLNDSTWTDYSNWSDIRISSQLASDGSKYDYRSKARCYSLVAISPVVYSAQINYIKPIQTPNPVTVAVVNNGSSVNYDWSVSICPMGTISRYRYKIITNPGNYDSGWENTSVNSLTQAGFSKIKSYTMTVNNQCYTNYIASDWSSDATGSYSYCPVGFIGVPGSITYGTSDFCVMKYEAKKSNNIAVSTAAGSPWVSISQNSAMTTSEAACDGCHLITEPEWLTIAQNIASNPVNWSSGAVGTGYIYRGHSDGSVLVPNMLDADPAGDNGYYRTGNSAPSNQRRTLSLSTGDVIWDIAGNVVEWTSGQISGGQPGPANGYLWREWDTMTIFGSANPNPHPSASGISGSENWNSSNGIGKIYNDANVTSLRGFRRGSNYHGGDVAGIYSVFIDLDPGSTYFNLGFRVSKP